MEVGNILALTIKSVRLHKEERKMQGDLFGVYSSNYIAFFREYPNGWAVIDEIVSKQHPDWKRKTDNRASILTAELSGKKFTIRVLNVFSGENVFEGEIIQ